MPEIVLIAGPNGSGKSSAALSVLREGYAIINPDTLAKHAGISGQAPLAGRLVINAVRENIADGHSFAVETTLSGRSYFRVLADARENGFRVNLVYIATDRPAINLLRVAERVAAGGHDVPKKDVVRRYHRSLANLPAFLDLSDQAALLDNSGTEHKLVAEKRDGRLIQHVTPLPDWVATALTETQLEAMALLTMLAQGEEQARRGETKPVEHAIKDIRAKRPKE